MTIYPTLTELAGIVTPRHVEGRSIAVLLRDPQAPWPRSAVTTYGYGNSAARSERWRYIRYANGDEELYDEEHDPYEWKNLAALPRHAAEKAELANELPASYAPDVSKNSNEKAAKRERRKDRRARDRNRTSEAAVSVD